MPLFHKCCQLSRKQTSTATISDDITLCQLISDQDWLGVDHLLANTSRPDHVTSLSLNTAVAIEEDLILHYACVFNAPLQTITKLSARFPSSLNTVDNKLRFPVHLAVASGCKPDVIQFLIRTSPSYAGIQDYYGKTPLHYTGDYAKNCIINNYFGVPNPNLDEAHQRALDVVKLLVEAAPQSVNVEDVDEMNPIECAVLNDVNVKIIKTMQRASKKDWRQRQKYDGRKCHEDLASDVQDSSSLMLDDLSDTSSHMSTSPLFGQRRNARYHRILG